MASEFKVLARGDAMVLDASFARSSGGHRRFVGRMCTVHPTLEAAPAGAGVVLREVDPVEPQDNYFVEAWSRMTEPVVVTSKGDLGSYFRARLQEGALWPADKATADAAGVAYDPSFGGEYPQLVKSSSGRKGGE